MIEVNKRKEKKNDRKYRKKNYHKEKKAEEKNNVDADGFTIVTAK